MPSEACPGKPRDGLGAHKMEAKFREEKVSQDTQVPGRLALRWQTDAVKCELLPCSVVAVVLFWVLVFPFLVFVSPLFKFLPLPSYRSLLWVPFHI